MSSAPKKLVLVVIDAMKPAMLELAVTSGRAPALKRIMEEGVYVSDAIAPFPSVTPVCAATITTGLLPDRHLIPGMNWFHRHEGRYVEYGTSFPASRQFGLVRSLTDTVYRMNAEHLSGSVQTVFETLDDAAVRTAGTTYLIYRGRHEHAVAQETALSRVATSTLFRRTVLGPRELFYADLYASRKTGCRSQLGMPGVRDQHTGCVGSYLAEHDLYDFMLFSLPDNDAYSHRNGPDAQVVSIAAADRQLERLMHAGGGPDRFLEENAVIVVSDHSQAAVTDSIRLDLALTDFEVLNPRSQSRRPSGEQEPEIAISPSSRAAQIYALNPDRRAETVSRVLDALAPVPGIDLMIWLSGGGATVDGGGEAVIRAAAGAELRFAPGSAVTDVRGASWDIDGDLSVLAAVIHDGILVTPDYPDALSRTWASLHCENAGDVQLSAAPGYEFVDWGGADHVGGGSHGSLHRSDSAAALLWCGTGPDSADAQAAWALTDVTPMILEHFGVNGEKTLPQSG